MVSVCLRVEKSHVMFAHSRSEPSFFMLHAQMFGKHNLHVLCRVHELHDAFSLLLC